LRLYLRAMRKFTFLLVLAFVVFSVKAQMPEMSQEPILPDNPKGGSFGFSLKAGTMGAGLEFAKSLNAKRTITARIGGTYLPIEYNGIEQNVQGSKIVGDVSGNIGNGFLMLDFHPFGNAFKFTLGGAYMLTNIKGVARMKDTIQQGEIFLDPTKVGIISLDVSPAKFSPYAGIGFGRAIPKNRVGFSFEIGTYYIGAPQLNFSATGLLEPTSNQQSVLQKGLDQYRWLPQVMFNLTFKLAK